MSDFFSLHFNNSAQKTLTYGVVFDMMVEHPLW